MYLETNRIVEGYIDFSVESIKSILYTEVPARIVQGYDVMCYKNITLFLCVCQCKGIVRRLG